MCGLRLDTIAAEFAAQRPSARMDETFDRRRWMQKLGLISLSMAGVVALALVFAQVFYYKLLIFGPALLFGSAMGGILLLLLAAVFFFYYPRFFMKQSYAEEQAEIECHTNKLLNDPPFEPASVTEHSTELLHRK